MLSLHGLFINVGAKVCGAQPDKGGAFFSVNWKNKEKARAKNVENGAGYGIIWISNRGRALMAVSNPLVKRR